MGMGQIGQALDIGHRSQRVGRSLQKQQFGLRLDGRFPSAIVCQFDKCGLEPEFGQYIIEEIDRGSKDAARRDNVITAPEQAQAGTQYGTHAG